MQTSSTLGPWLAAGLDELLPGLAVVACWAAGLVQPAMARTITAPYQSLRRMVTPINDIKSR